jgi:hypothetical protein
MSAYAKLPEDPEVSAKKVAERALATAGEGASRVAQSFGRGLRRAGAELEAPAHADLAALLGDTNLPELSLDDALASLARRVDREADLWRNLAIRELAHVAWANRVAHLASITMMVGVLVLAGIGAFHALFSGVASRAWLLLTAAGVLALGAAVANVASAAVRRSQREVVRDALVRADVAELRLHRIGIAVASAQAEGTKMRDALGRLERDVTG